LSVLEICESGGKKRGEMVRYHANRRGSRYQENNHLQCLHNGRILSY
jgi:hypothetical protein